ncbi:MAG: F0F1 ATP synthase subunit A [Candidatus Margulisiibacteriota bacterium]
MDKIGKVSSIQFELFGRLIELNPNMLLMTYIVIAFLAISAFLGTRNLQRIPGKAQNIFEVLFEFIEEVTLGTLGNKDGKAFVPFIFSIFVFVLAANWIGILPHITTFFGFIIAMIHQLFTGEAGQWIVDGVTKTTFVPNSSTFYYFLFKVPEFEEPTRSINTDLALGLLVFIIVHINSLRKHGFLDYFRSYMGDIVPSHGWWILLFPINPFFYLNLISEVSSVVSHSFRLFGNIFGGFMILVIVSSLVKHFLVPVGLLAFFGLFAGIVQAFVFTMLAITYIGQKN